MVQRHLGAVGLLVVAALSGCSNGVEAGTLDPAQPFGAQADLGAVQIRNAFIVQAERRGDEAVIALTVVNNGTAEDTLSSLRTVDGAIEAELSPSSISLPAGLLTVVPTESDPSISLDTDAAPGTYLEVIMQFENAGTATMSIPVVLPTGPYATLMPAPGS